jgi:hypothetical protein
MLEVQKIAVINEAAFNLTFHVDFPTGSRSQDSKTYPLGQTEIIDLAPYGVEDGTEVHPVVSADGGGSKAGDPVTYSANDQVATYEVKGATLTYTVDLVQ